ncbi:MAG: hypothetical protein LUO93_07885 [Methanomicrobiales archaeon]|nr:hypothetical protein [Methanomicrobiales archaeon]
MIARLALAVLLAGASAATAQEKGRAPGRVDEVRINAAIKKGAESLKGRAWREFGGRDMTCELVLLAMVHAGVPEKDAAFAGFFKGMLEERPETTYRTALRAMVLEEVERVKYQVKIFECAQFLVDNQGQNGQWSYGEPTVLPAPTPAGRKEVATGPPPPPAGTLVVFSDPSGKPKPPVVQRIAERKQRDGPPCGDNSNSQYAALGLRACHDAGIVFPKEVVSRAAQWWRECQINDSNPAGGGRVATGGGPRPRGWGYRGQGEEPYGSMTAGAVGALVICDYILGTDWKKDDNVNAGVNWIRDNYSVIENPRRGRGHHYYYLYALERAGILYDTESFGRHDWYAEGAAVLLEEQTAGGSWGSVVDTCFAILFLRRATRPLVESRDSKNPR